MLSAAEDSVALGLGEILMVADAQVVARVLQLVLDDLTVEPRLSGRRDSVRAQCVEHGVIVGVARCEVEYELRGDAQARHAGVVDGAPELVAAGRSGQGGPRLIEHPRQPGVPLELHVETAGLTRSQVRHRQPF